MLPAPTPSPTLQRFVLGPRQRAFRQREMFCACGQATPALAGLCRRCYRRRAHSRFYFAGHREAALARDRYACQACGAGQTCRLHVHHRQPGRNDEAFLVTVCAACHARLHRLAALRHWVPEPLIPLWAEQHPGIPLQLQLSLEPLVGMSRA